MGIHKIGAVLFLGLLATSCIQLKENAMYQESNEEKEEFFQASEIYTDVVTSEAWATEGTSCIQVEAKREAAYQGDYGLHIKWDAVTQNCPWLGIGFGWDNWTGKDLSGIINVAAIEFYVKSLSGDRTSLPWAVGLEDFTAAQAWLGLGANTVKGDGIGSEWTRIEVPFSEFNWEQEGADPSNIKQVIINLNADGEVFIDEVRIVPYEGGFRKRYTLNESQKAPVIDGKKDDIWMDKDVADFKKNKFHMMFKGDKLFLALEVEDETPMQNSFSKDEIWNGDAFEMAFSTSPTANPRRTNYLLTDQHFGIKLGNEVTAWNWTKEEPFKINDYRLVQTANGYYFEVEISLSELSIPPMETGILYGLEIAVDHGDNSGRQYQDRWNSSDMDGFYHNPSLWGEMLILESSHHQNKLK